MHYFLSLLKLKKRAVLDHARDLALSPLSCTHYMYTAIRESRAVLDHAQDLLML